MSPWLPITFLYYAASLFGFPALLLAEQRRQAGKMMHLEGMEGAEGAVQARLKAMREAE